MGCVRDRDPYAAEGARAGAAASPTPTTGKFSSRCQQFGSGIPLSRTHPVGSWGGFQGGVGAVMQGAYPLIVLPRPRLFLMQGGTLVRPSPNHSSFPGANPATISHHPVANQSRPDQSTAACQRGVPPRYKQTLPGPSHPDFTYPRAKLQGYLAHKKPPPPLGPPQGPMIHPTVGS